MRTGPTSSRRSRCAGLTLPADHAARRSAERQPASADRPAANGTRFQSRPIPQLAEKGQLEPHHARPDLVSARQPQRPQCVDRLVEQHRMRIVIRRPVARAVPRRNRPAYSAARSVRSRGNLWATRASVNRSRLPVDLRSRTISQSVSKSRAFSKAERNRRPPLARRAHPAELARPERGDAAGLAPVGRSQDDRQRFLGWISRRHATGPEAGDSGSSVLSALYHRMREVPSYLGCVLFIEPLPRLIEGLHSAPIRCLTAGLPHINFDESRGSSALLPADDFPSSTPYRNVGDIAMLRFLFSAALALDFLTGCHRSAAEELPRGDPKDHWAFRSPVRVVAPTIRNPHSAFRNPVDAFLAAERAKHGLTPQSAAERRLLLRRVYLDLIGLPPTPRGSDGLRRRPLAGRLRAGRRSAAGLAAVRRALGPALDGHLALLRLVGPRRRGAQQPEAHLALARLDRRVAQRRQGLRPDAAGDARRGRVVSRTTSTGCAAPASWRGITSSSTAIAGWKRRSNTPPRRSSA